VVNLIGTSSQELTMPAQSHHLSLRSAAFVLTLALGACQAGENSLAPDMAEPAAGGPVDESAPATPEMLTAGSGPRILFSSARTGGIDIYRMAPDGSGVVRVTTFAGPDQTPAWSWNNSQIAFVRNRLDASNVIHKDIYLMNADGTGKRWARSAPTSWDITDPSWSKDGTRLVVSVWIKGAGRSITGTPYLAILTVANGNMSFVNASLGGPIGFTPSFDPTGKKIVYVGLDAHSLEMINADGTGHKTIMASDSGRGTLTSSFIYPAFSPDGKKIAFTTNSVTSWDLYVRTLADGTTKRLTSSPGMNMHPTWSADGARIAFTSNRTGKSQIYTVPSNGGTQMRITNGSYAETAPAWSH